MNRTGKTTRTSLNALAEVDPTAVTAEALARNHAVHALANLHRSIRLEDDQPGPGTRREQHQQIALFCSQYGVAAALRVLAQIDKEAADRTAQDIFDALDDGQNAGCDIWEWLTGWGIDPEQVNKVTDAIDAEKAAKDPRAAWDLFSDIARITSWLDDQNGYDTSEVLLRILKVTEEAGEAAAAVIGWKGQNPRKGRTHRWDEVAGELCDVVIAALVAVNTLARNSATARGLLAARVAGVLKRADGDAAADEAVSHA